MIAYSTPVAITAILAAFLALLAVIALARSIVLRGRITPWREYKVGVFLERRDRLPKLDEEEASTRVDWPKPS